MSSELHGYSHNPQAPEDGTADTHVLSYGSKDLRVIINTEKHVASTFVQNIPGRNKLSGETTELYRQAYVLMEDYATHSGRAISYRLLTENPSMKAWAQDRDKGRAIFPFSFGKWDEYMIAEAIILPKNLL